MTPTLKVYSKFVLPSWTMFSHIKKWVVQWPAVCDSWSLYCTNTWWRARATFVYIRYTLASVGLWLAHVWFLKIVSMQESVCVFVCVCVCVCACLCVHVHPWSYCKQGKICLAKISRSFQEYRKNFLWILILYKLRMIVFLNVRHHESFSVKNFIGWNPQKFSLVNLSLFTVLIASGMIWTPYDWLNKFYSIIIMGLLACTWHTT